MFHFLFCDRLSCLTVLRLGSLLLSSLYEPPRGWIEQLVFLPRKTNRCRFRLKKCCPDPLFLGPRTDTGVAETETKSFRDVNVSSGSQDSNIVVLFLLPRTPLVPRSVPRAGMFGSRLISAPQWCFFSYAISQVRRPTDGISFVQILRESFPPSSFLDVPAFAVRENASFMVGIPARLFANSWQMGIPFQDLSFSIS